MIPCYIESRTTKSLVFHTTVLHFPSRWLEIPPARRSPPIRLSPFLLLHLCECYSHLDRLVSRIVLAPKDDELTRCDGGNIGYKADEVREIIIARDNERRNILQYILNVAAYKIEESE